MSEAREQYRERLAFVADMAMSIPPIDDHEAAARRYWPSYRQRERAAEAVAAQVLRDVLHDFQQWPYLDQRLTEWAAERGIDLTDPKVTS